MSENLEIAGNTKEEFFETLIPQIENLILGETNLIANLANVSAAIKMTFNHLWVGFYLVEGNQLVLGPFQGPIACTRILKGKGVCGSAWENEETIIVANVNEFPGHISCSSQSVSEIVIPIFNPEKKIIGVLDVDSKNKNQFDTTDKFYFEKINSLITKSLP
ncbi:MAG: GAF domain-containing protein [Salibacteraceae bacterium]